MIWKSPSLLVQTWGAAIFVSANTGRRHVFFQGAAMFRVNWRPHPAELMRPGVNFGGTRGLGSALVFRRLPAIACNGSRDTRIGRPLRGWGLRWCSDGVSYPSGMGFFFAAGLVCSAELASGVGEMIASL